MKRSLYAILVIAALLAGVFVLAPVPPVYAQAAQCDKTATVAMASGTTIVLVSGAGGGVTSVCGFYLSSGTALATGQFKVGTGTVCGTGGTAISAAIIFAAGGNGNFISNLPILQVYQNSSGVLPDLCISSLVGGLQGFVIYGKN